MTEPNPQDTDEQEQSSHDADSNSSTNQKTNWNHGRPHSESNAQGRQLVVSSWNHIVDLQAEQVILESGKNDCQTPAISSKQKRCWKQGRPAKRWEDDINAYLQPATTNRNKNDLTNDTTWLTTAQDGLKWDSTGSVFVSSRLKNAMKTHDHDNQTNSIRLNPATTTAPTTTTHGSFSPN